MDWDVEVTRGSAAEFHARPIAGAEPKPGVESGAEVDVASVWWFEIDRPAIVLGSGQSDDVVDRGVCERLGIDVVRRHSGGGAVLLIPGEVAWFDVVIPRVHERWDQDVSRAAWWLGEAVSRALGDPTLEVHRGPLVRTRWSSLVCFAGLGPGEITRGGRKVLGLSQRRTRDAIRYQCAVYRTWSAAVLVEVLAHGGPTLAELADLVATADLTLDALIRELSV